MKRLSLIFLSFCALAVSCVPENHGGGSVQLNYERMFEMKTVIQETLDTAKVGEQDGQYPQSSYDDLSAELVNLKSGISKARAGVFILQFEVDNYVNSAEKALKLFQESKIVTVPAGAKAELFVNGIDHKGYIDFGSSTEYDPVNMTVEAWTKLRSDFIEFTFGSFISTFISPIPYKGWTLHYWGVANSLLRFSIGTDNANPDLTLPTIYATAPSNYGEWFHVAATFDASSGVMNLYFDGELAATTTISDKMVPGTSSEECRMWAFVEPKDHSRCHSGYIKNFRLWSTAKTGDEIKTLMNSEVKGDEKNLVCAWDFTIKPEDDTNIVDKTGRHTAVITGTYKWTKID